MSASVLHVANPQLLTHLMIIKRVVESMVTVSTDTTLSGMPFFQSPNPQHRPLEKRSLP